MVLLLVNSLAGCLIASILLENMKVKQVKLADTSKLKKPHNFQYPQTSLAKNFYRMYKYMYVQTCSGTRAEDILKNLHQIVVDKHLKKILIQMSVIISHNNDTKLGIAYLKTHFSHEEGMILIGILEGSLVSGLSKESFLRLDHMLFQKYLAQMRKDTKKIRKKYFAAVVCFVISASGVIFLPLIDQMFQSAQIIFR